MGWLRRPPHRSSPRPTDWKDIGVAILAIATATGVTLLLRATLSFWSVGAAGALSRGVSVLTLAGWVAMRGAGVRRLSPLGVAGWLLLMGAISILINLSWFAGMLWTTATNATLLFRLDLLFVILIGAFLGTERLTPLTYILLPFMGVGLALVMEVRTLGSNSHARGDALIIVAAVGLAVNAFVIRHILRRMDVEAVALYNHFISGIGFTVLFAIQAPALSEIAQAEASDWIWIVVLGVLAAVALPLYYAALARLAIWKLRALMLLGPAMAAVVEWFIWGKTLHGGQWLGAIVLVLGAGALILADRPAEPTEPKELPRIRLTS